MFLNSCETKPIKKVVKLLQKEKSHWRKLSFCLNKRKRIIICTIRAHSPREKVYNLREASSLEKCLQNYNNGFYYYR